MIQYSLECIILRKPSILSGLYLDPTLIFAESGQPGKLQPFTLVGYDRSNIATIVLAVVHGIAGMIIFLLPIILSIQGSVPAGYTLVGIGGALIGAGGLLLAFLRMGKPILSRKIILTILPVLLFLMTAAFVGGFSMI